MTDRDRHVAQLFTAELQFRLASAVRIATTRKLQPLDLPLQWTHGAHRVDHETIALRPEQAEYAACFLQRSATYLMAVTVKDAIKATVPDPKRSTDPHVRAAYQVARLVRNAFAHAPLAPAWSIDPVCRDQVFEVPGVARLDTTGLQGVPLDWRHYGGPLALLKLCRFVRFEILKDDVRPRSGVQPPGTEIHQVGDLMLVKADTLPPGCVPVEPLVDGTIPLGGGFSFDPAGSSAERD